MRLDKWLKVARIIKRRTVAKEVCDAGRVQVNGRIAKAGTEIKVGDQVSLTMGPKSVNVKVLATPDTVPAGEAHTLYEEL
ncbi:MAG: RNA-binding S4 domain-containing protein [Clostridia bacterium]|nr:RNA-binding S4 domain-containing protein [Clostridia bacterium]